MTDQEGVSLRQAEGRAGVLVPVTPTGPWHPIAERHYRLLDQGRYSEVLDTADSDEHLMVATGDDKTLGYLLLARAKALFELGRTEESVAVDERRLALHRAAGYTVGEVKSLADAAQGLFALGRVAEGLARLGRAVWLLESVPPRGERYVSAVLSIVASAQAAELYETGAGTLRRLLTELDGPLRPVVLASPRQAYYVEDYYAELLLEWGLRLEHLGRVDEAVVRWQRAARLLEAWADDDEVEDYSRAMRALVLAKLGRPADALAVAEPLVLAVREGEGYRTARLGHLAAGVAHRRLGDRRAARRELVAAEQLLAYGGTAAERIVLQQELGALVLDEVEPEPRAALQAVLRGQAERLWEFRLQRLATLRQARLREQQDADRVHLDRALLQDPLTALGNRRRFDERLDALEPGSEAAPLALLLLDVDRFKVVNDVHSHPVGDQVLREIAGVLRAHSRAADVAVRLGGDEFAVFLHATTAEAVEIAHRIREAVAAIDWPRLSPGLTVTVSTGVAALSGEETGADLFAAADAKLYEAKRAGRNRIAS